MARPRKKGVAPELPLPNQDAILMLAKGVVTACEEAPFEGKYAPVKHVLALVAAGTTFQKFLSNPKWRPEEEDKSREADMLRRYNPYYVRRAIDRLKKQKLIERLAEGAGVGATTTGKRKILKYALEDLVIPKPKSWDGKWRLVIYDVDASRASLRNIFRSMLKRLGFFKLQNSVWLYPYPCEKEVRFLRDYYGVGSEVVYVIAHKIENDGAYRQHFGLK